MLRLLFITLFLIIPFIINADHMKASKWNGESLKTNNLEDMYNMKIGDNIM